MENIPIFSVESFVFLLGFTLLIGGAVFLHGKRRQKVSAQILQWYLKAATLPIYKEALPEFQRELARVKRYRRPLALILLTPRENASAEIESIINNGFSKNGRLNGKKTRQKFTQIELLLLGAAIQECLREVDMIGYDSVRRRYVLLLPESDYLQAEQMMKRINERILPQFRHQLTIGIAEYSNEIETFEELVSRADLVIQSKCRPLREYD